MTKKKKKTGKKKKVVKAKKLTTSKICCTECGDCKGMSKDRRAKLIATFGSEEELHAKYVCRTCRTKLNLRKDGKAKPVKRKRIPKATSKFKRTEDGDVVLPKWMTPVIFRERRLCTDTELAQIKTCFATSYWSDHKYCNGCHRLEKNICGCDTKVILTDKEMAKHTKACGTIKKSRKVKTKKVKKGKK